MPTCDKCNRDFLNNAGLNNHKRFCDGTLPAQRWSCPKCNHYIHSQRDRHVEICDGLGPGAHKRNGKNEKQSVWNKGLKTNEETKARISASLIGKAWKASSPEIEFERRRKISEKMKSNPAAGGYRIGSGVGKGGWYNSSIAGRVYLDSSFEMRVGECLDSNGITWERNKEKFSYFYDGNFHNYTPDFKIEGTFVEVKGFITDKDKAKWEFFPHKLILLKESDIIEMELGNLPSW